MRCLIYSTLFCWKIWLSVPKLSTANLSKTLSCAAKRRGYFRNIVVALGNSRDIAALPALEKASQDDEPLIREHAAWAIEKIQNRVPTSG